VNTDEAIRATLRHEPRIAAWLIDRAIQDDGRARKKFTP
jgi:hypothetical protein